MCRRIDDHERRDESTEHPSQRRSPELARTPLCPQRPLSPRHPPAQPGLVPGRGGDTSASAAGQPPPQLLAGPQLPAPARLVPAAGRGQGQKPGLHGAPTRGGRGGGGRRQRRRGRPRRQGRQEGRRTPEQEEEEDENGVLQESGVPAGVDVRHEEVLVELGEGGAGGVPSPHRNPGQDLVPEPEEQVEETAGRRAGGGKHGSSRPEARPGPHPLPRGVLPSRAAAPPQRSRHVVVLPVPLPLLPPPSPPRPSILHTTRQSRASPGSTVGTRLKPAVGCSLRPSCTFSEYSESYRLGNNIRCFHYHSEIIVHSVKVSV